MPSSDGSAAFHRDISHSYPVAARGEGAVVIDSEGRRFIDGAGGFIAILGHSPGEVAKQIFEQADVLQFAHTGDFTSTAEERFARTLLEIAPPGFAKVWITTSGSTANEAAVKLARQYHVLKGQPEKSKVVSRWHSYHGSTLGALSLGGATARRRLYEPYMLDFPHVTPPYCYRCPLALEPSSCAVACANEVEAAITLTGPQYVSAVITEVVSSGPLGALASPPEYLRRVRSICDRYDALLIVDEVVSGLGRTGQWFAVQESAVVPDIITLAKGLAGGFMPMGALLVHERVYETFRSTGTSFVHGESFTGHLMLGTAATAVINYIIEKDLLERVNELAKRLDARLSRFAELPMVGEVRGRGVLRGIELVRDKNTKEPFPRAWQAAENVLTAAANRNVLLLVGNGCADGINGDTVVIAPPYVITDEQLDQVVTALAAALQEVAGKLLNRRDN